MPRWSCSTRSTCVRRLAGSTSRVDGLALNGELVHRAVSFHHELVVRGGLGNGEQRVLDVRGVHVDASHDDHVVAPAAKAPDPRRRPAAAARLEGDRGDVAGAVAEQRHRLLEQGREDELALVALVERRTGLRVDDLDEEVVLVDVEAVAHLEALGRDAGAAHLGEPVEVDRPEPGQHPFDLLAQTLGPRLAAEQAELELQRRPGRCPRRARPARSRARTTASRRAPARRGRARSIACRAVKPPETGTTGAPIRSAPWWKPWPPVNRPYVFALCTSIPGRTPASVMHRAISSVQASRSAAV